MKQSIILGNIITMDDKRPFAKAALVKNGVFAYIGSAEEVKELASTDAQVLDYGDNSIRALWMAMPTGVLQVTVP